MIILTAIVFFANALFVLPFSSLSSWSSSTRRFQITIPQSTSAGSRSNTKSGRRRVFPSSISATTATQEEATVDSTTNNNISDISNNNNILATLFGSAEARDKFFERDFGRNVVHIQRNSNSNNIRDLELPCIFPDTGKINMQVLFDTSNYIALRKRGSLNYLNKTSTSYQDFCDYIHQDGEGGSAVIPVAEENALMPFRQDIETAMKEYMINNINKDNNKDNIDNDNISVGINVYHSGPNAVALTRHYDQYDVFVLHLDGQKDWEVGNFGTKHTIDMNDANSVQHVVSWTNITLVPGDVLYIPKGIYHAATTREGYDSTTHATIGLEYID